MLLHKLGLLQGLSAEKGGQGGRGGSGHASEKVTSPPARKTLTVGCCGLGRDGLAVGMVRKLSP